MADDHTVEFSTYFPLTLHVIKGSVRPGELRFIHSFRIGRSEECEVQCLDRSVSRVHVEVIFEGGQWWAQDHQSRNGIFLDGQKIDRVPLPASCSLTLGTDGPRFSIDIANLLDREIFSPSSKEDKVPLGTSTGYLAKEPIPTSPGVPVVLSPRSESLEEKLARLDLMAKQAEQKSKELMVQRKNVEEVAISTGAIDNPMVDKSEFEQLPGPIVPHASEVRLSPSPSNPSISEVGRSTEEPPGDQQSSVSSGLRRRFARKPPPESPTQILRQVFREHLDHETEEGEEYHRGPSTVVIRDALNQAFKQKSRPYLMYLGVLGAIAILFGVVAVVQYFRLESMKDTAQEIFFSMKTMELELSQLENLVVKELPPDKLRAILARREKLQTMQVQYDQFLEKIGIYSSDMDAKDRIIMRMARLFGECEIGMPADFVQTVKGYIDKWRSTDRLSSSLQRAHQRGYGSKVAEIMLRNQMPPQFFYLALQESGFDIEAIGPRTRFGIAKGPWQFIPTTAVDYGLSMGPLVEIRQYDPRDERHNFEKSTTAAAKYLKDIYSTEAQASGLLVMASYNWGQTRVRNLIQRLPKNPRERNFWELLKKSKIPRETYDYVFYIFSAAVIGENPKLFGFPFKKPLGFVE
ncbi:MAG: FHA domain-containing protein [Nitrospira sp.]|nr:FHA domain-containing protein [Nitrospira sp.]MDR4486013.1 FHA domain-containing protein [Nitrospirales bacterium]